MQTKKLFDFNERKNAAEEARKAAAEKFSTMKARLDDPEVQKRMAEQKAIAEARAAREAEKRAAKLAVKQAEDAARLAAKREAERKAQEVELKAAALLRSMALDAELEAAVVTVVDIFEVELLTVVAKIATHLKTLHALEGGAVGALLVKEVKARVERALYVL